MSERIFGGVLLLVSLAGIWIGWDLQAPMSYEPVGPRAFPLLVLFLLGVAKLAYDIVQMNLSESAIFAFLAAIMIWSLGLIADMISRLHLRP